MTETQKKAVEDLKSIINEAKELIKKLNDGLIDGIESETLEIYCQISNLNFY